MGTFHKQPPLLQWESLQQSHVGIWFEESGGSRSAMEAYVLAQTRGQALWRGDIIMSAPRCILANSQKGGWHTPSAQSTASSGTSPATSASAMPTASSVPRMASVRPAAAEPRAPISTSAADEERTLPIVAPPRPA